MAKLRECRGDIQWKEKDRSRGDANGVEAVYMTSAPDCVHGEDSCSIFGIPVVWGTDD